MIRYFKIYQREQVWHYIKLLEERCPKAMEVINFLNPRPQIYFYEVNLSDPGSCIEYQALASATPIEAGEYEQAYALATQERFDVYIDGQKQ